MAKKLDTIQTHELLNTVHAMDDPGPGGANHIYWIRPTDTQMLTPQGQQIMFQKGARALPTSATGVIDSDLLETVRHRLTCFQEGDFACDYNAQALYHVEEALKALNRRVEDRINRKVLGKEEK